MKLRVGRPSRRDGQSEISNARELFEQSKADGRPNFRYLALAIGAAPINPPEWAIWECVSLVQRNIQKAATDSLGDIGWVLDDVIRQTLEHELNYLAALDCGQHASDAPLDTYRPLSFSEAVSQALKNVDGGKWVRHRNIRRSIKAAWDREQKQERAARADQAEPSSAKYLATPRVVRVLGQLQMADDPSAAPYDPELFVYIGKLGGVIREVKTFERIGAIKSPN